MKTKIIIKNLFAKVNGKTISGVKAIGAGTDGSTAIQLEATIETGRTIGLLGSGHKGIRQDGKRVYAWATLSADNLKALIGEGKSLISFVGKELNELIALPEGDYFYMHTFESTTPHFPNDKPIPYGGKENAGITVRTTEGLEIYRRVELWKTINGQEMRLDQATNSYVPNTDTILSRMKFEQAKELAIADSEGIFEISDMQNDTINNSVVELTPEQELKALKAQLKKAGKKAAV